MSSDTNTGIFPTLPVKRRHKFARYMMDDNPVTRTYSDSGAGPLAIASAGVLSILVGTVWSIVIACLRIGPTSGDEQPLIEHLIAGGMIALPASATIHCVKYRTREMYAVLDSNVSYALEQCIYHYNRIVGYGKKDVIEAATSLLNEVQELAHHSNDVNVLSAVRGRQEIIHSLANSTKAEHVMEVTQTLPKDDSFPVANAVALLDARTTMLEMRRQIEAKPS